MSRQNNTPNSGGSALECPAFFDVENGANSYAGVNQWSEGMIGPFLFSFITSVILFGMSLWFVPLGVFDWAGSILYKSLATVAIYLGIALFTYWPYRLIGIGVGSLSSAATFITVATYFPMPLFTQFVYSVLIGFLLIVGIWVSDVKKNEVML